MKNSALVQLSPAPKCAFSASQFVRMTGWTFKLPRLGRLYCFSLILASVGLGILADRSMAQVIYFTERPISFDPGVGVVSTNSGIGLNVRSGPGLRFPIIGGADDGNFVPVTGEAVFSDGYRWQQVNTSTGGWVATDYLTGGGLVNVSTNNCVREVNFGCGGPSQPIVNPIVRPISTTAGPYVVAVPGTDARTVAQVRQVVPRAYTDRAREGGFVNAGNFSDYETAKSLSYLLRSNGLDARVIYK